MAFPTSFLWGAATASYQIEGAARVDGRGDSIWDAFCRRAGNVKRGDTGDTACDHYHRLREDVALMKDLGLKAYRFSIAWPRVLPAGDGTPNEAGLAFYDRLVDALLDAGIQPWATLFHWDYPTELYCRGGWLNPASPDWFARYAELMATRLGDRVRHWMTLNEPQVFIGLGHDTGEHAPNLHLSHDLTLRATHNVLLSHGRAVRAIRTHARATPSVGWAPVGVSAYPDSNSPADIAAAYAFMAGLKGPTGATSGTFSNTMWADPVCLGHYPEEAHRLHGHAMPKPAPGDMDLISTPIDFYGYNVYFGPRIKAGPDGQPVEVPEPVGAPQTTMGWWITPESLYWCTRFLHERYRKPLYVTENGRAVSDHVDDDGRVRDPLRTTFLRRYLRQLERSIADGCNVRGYFCWSLMDNFEWAEGYGQRFGLIHVDYPTGTRTVKDSARWYSNVIRTNGHSLDAYPPA